MLSTQGEAQSEVWYLNMPERVHKPDEEIMRLGSVFFFLTCQCSAAPLTQLSHL